MIVIIQKPSNFSFPINYSNITECGGTGGLFECGLFGEGNIDIDPLFNNPEIDDYTLQENSACINAGTADLDGDGECDITDFYGDAPDMGAYEFYEESTGDLNGDNIINIQDIIVLVNIILNGTPCYPQADLNGDQLFNIMDLITLVNIILDA